MRGTTPNSKPVRVVFWSLMIGLILLVIILFLIPALLGSVPTTNPADEATAKAISATSTVKMRVVGAVEAAWTQTAQVTPEPDQ